MKRKNYQKPTMKVVELQQRATLLTTSTETQLNVTYTEKNWDEE